MGDVIFGTGLRTHDNVGPFARRIEALGYDVLSSGEHVMFHGPTGNTFVSLATAAGATTRLKLLSAIVLLPLYPAALAAKLGAALDVASGGRYLFGVGVGGEFPREFEACGVPVAERGARANEALEVIKRLWTERDVSFRGRFTTLEGATIQPPPVQRPHPPIWVAGRREAAMRRAARFADGWLPYMYTPEQLHASIATIRRLGEEAGRDMSGFTPGVFAFSAVHEDRATAGRMAAERLAKTYAQDFTRLVDKYALAGDPDYCRARLREYVDAGARMVILPPACPEEYADTSVSLMAETVLPALR